MSDARFNNLEPLGHGSYGYVYKALDTHLNETIAMKKIRLDLENQGLPAEVLREISILQDVKHPNIVKLLDVVPNESRIFLIFEFVDTDLRKILEQGETLSMSFVKSVINQLLKALVCCHGRRFMHRDVKPENVLLDKNYNIKLADFGLARAMQMPGRPYTKEVQTLWYRAPEVLFEEEQYNCQIDVWSVGCILGEMLIGRPLFTADNPLGQLIEICKIRGTPQTQGLASKATQMLRANYQKVDLAQLVSDPLARDLLDQMLEVDPDKRISAKYALEHPFFQELID